MEKTAYEILGVSPTATDEEIKKQYHTLIRNVHSDATFLKDLTEEEREKCEKLVREYNGAYGKLSKGKRADYDRTLVQQRGTSRVIYEEPVQKQYTTATEFVWGDPEEVVRRAAAKKSAEKVFEEQFNDLFKNIFQSGFSFWGSVTPDPNQNLRQDYWKLKSEKEKLGRDLRMAEQDVRIEYMKQSSTNEIQLGIDSRNIVSRMSSSESKRNMELQGIRQNYFFKLNKRFMTDKKRQRLLQEQQQEEDKVNAKYNLLREQYESKRVKIEMDLAAYQKAEKAAIENNSRVQEIKGKLEAVQRKLDTIAVKLGYQAQTSDYTSSYGERSRVSA